MAFCIIQTALIISIAFSDNVPAEVRRYSGSKSLGQMIDKTVYYAVFFIALGTLAEIGQALRNRVD
ncbi:hypothetical protein GV67_22555 [Pseudorhizobium pelagicum]|uniref:Uncharacterized protein n=1 Tax=Pseudorhizobium pelagicum TaxID=1509405 RepID=A0A922P4Y6_9HYPH|nr:hypothetical protein GV67_22555 [Pseudorhizobium pelagicum]KEQ09965.1 hypothetical protein GV68_18345 [Pseudorhizobium pelagicum]